MKIMDLERNKLIYTLYFDSKLNISEISKKVNLSVSQISRILNSSPLYLQEKANRKRLNYIKHNEQAKEIIKRKREFAKAQDKAIMDMLHKQASLELSTFKSLGNIALRKNCSSAYIYNDQKKRFELKNDAIYSNDMPAKIKY